MKGLFLIMMLAMVWGCERRFYTPMQKLPENTQCIQLNNSYQFYTRKVYKNTPKGDGGEFVTNKSVVGADLIEVEYLLISYKTKNVIYITTIPDRKQTYFSGHTLPDSTLLNMQDLNRFQFGILSGDSITFTSKDERSRNVWVMRPGKTSHNKDSIIHKPSPRHTMLHIEQVEQQVRKRNDNVFVFDNLISVADALEEPVYFIKQNSFRFVLFNDNTGANNLPELLLNRIHFIHHGRRFTLYLEMDKRESSENDFTVLCFSNKRVHFSPAPLVKE